MQHTHKHTHTHYSATKLCRWSTDLCKNLFFVVQTKMFFFCFGGEMAERDGCKQLLRATCLKPMCCILQGAKNSLPWPSLCSLQQQRRRFDSLQWERERARAIKSRPRDIVAFPVCMCVLVCVCVCVRAHTLLISRNEAINQNKIKKCESLRLAWEKHVPCT